MSYYIQTAAGDKVVSKFELALDAVYRARGLDIAESVLRGVSDEGIYLYDSENDWNMDELTDSELASLRALAKTQGLHLWLVLGE